MRIRFTKMHGAGNDFVVLDETKGPLGLTAAHYRYLGDRHLGVGADQILTVRPARSDAADFEYIIHNADGSQVEQCGNGSRCFARYVHDKGLTHKEHIKVQTLKGVIEPRLNSDGRVTVDMGAPYLSVKDVPFDATGLTPQPQGDWQLWPVDIQGDSAVPKVLPMAVASMGNPHAVLLVDDLDATPVGVWGPAVQANPRFAQGVNVGFMQVISRREVRLRVYERGVGETLACGSGSCAAVVLGRLLGLLDEQVDVHTRGGVLTIAWSGSAQQPQASVLMTGPATTVYEGELEFPAHLD